MTDETVQLPDELKYEHQIACSRTGLVLIFGSAPSTLSIGEKKDKKLVACTAITMFVQVPPEKIEDYAIHMQFEGTLPADGLFKLGTGKIGNGMSSQVALGGKVILVRDRTGFDMDPALNTATGRWLGEFARLHPIDFSVAVASSAGSAARATS